MKIIESQEEKLDEEIKLLYEKAQVLSEDVMLFKVLNEASKDPAIQEMAIRQPKEFLSSRGVDLPEGIIVKFLKISDTQKPFPDWYSYTIRLTKCRTFWTQDKPNKSPEKQEVCFGIEIIPNVDR